MLRKMSSYFTLPLLLLLLGNSSGNSAPQAPGNSSEGQSGTREKLIVATGSVTMDFNLDRLKGIDEDIARMERILPDARPPGPRVSEAIAQALGRPRRDTASCRHRPPAGFRSRQAVAIEVAVEKGRKLGSARLYYRHVNQAEHWESIEMDLREGVFRAVIPAAYTDSPYPLQYYCELKEAPDKAWIYPGFAPKRANLPYIVLRRM